MSTTTTNTNSTQEVIVGIVGATGAVGKELRSCLEKNDYHRFSTNTTTGDNNNNDNKKKLFSISQLRLFGSERSAGTVMKSSIPGGTSIEIELFDVLKVRQCDIVFLAVSGSFSLQYAKEIIGEKNDGPIVIDNSSAFRYDSDIPLIVPEINGSETKQSKLIANPNCTTAIGLMAIWPLMKAFGCQRILMSTYQAASGAGQPGMDELQEGTKAYLLDLEKKEKKNDGETTVSSSSSSSHNKNKVFTHPLPFNVIPHIDVVQDNGYTKEEMKVTWESRKICSLPDDFPISCTAVRIPTMRAHAETIVMETKQPVTVAEAQQVLSKAPGVQLIDNIQQNQYPMPLTATGQYDVQVGRIRQSLVFHPNGLEFFVCGDQLLRGAALNAVLIAEQMIYNQTKDGKHIQQS